MLVKGATGSRTATFERLSCQAEMVWSKILINFTCSSTQTDETTVWYRENIDGFIQDGKMQLDNW